MTTPTTTAARLLPGAALLSLFLFSCGGSGGGSGSLKIVSCTLGCAGSGPGGDGQVSCGIADVYVNGELRVTFSQPIDPDSLSSFSMQITELGTGKNPTAKRFVSSSDPNTIVYRPSLTFDSSGGPVFGLAADKTYTLKLPGKVEDPGAKYVRSVGGADNQHRMQCTLDASLGVLDPKPGAPTVAVTVDVVTGYDAVSGQPEQFATDVPAAGASEVWRFSQIDMEFDDLMNPATLVNPITGSSASVQVLFDPDGDLGDTSDQFEILGAYSIQLDQDQLRTRVSFVPTVGYPSAGADPMNQRKVVVRFQPGVSDLGGNGLANGDDVAFTPESVVFPAATLTDTFDGVEQADLFAGGASWGETVSGFLSPGLGGGSGKHGELRLSVGDIVTLNTDFEDFSSLPAGAWRPADALEATFDGTAHTVPPVTDGIFEFASISLPTGSQLKFTGSRPARVFVRGQALVRGVIDAGAEDGPQHDSREIHGAEPNAAGPSGGLGGVGGRLPTWVGFESLATTIEPEDPLEPPPTLEELDGDPGAGVADNLLAPSGSFGAGAGGSAWPKSTPSFPAFHMPLALDDVDGVQWDGFYLGCGTKMLGASGAGGAFGLNGGSGQVGVIPGGSAVAAPPPTPSPGQASDFSVGIGSDPMSAPRTLSPEDGWLHGGAGGGGGGSHIASSRTDGSFADCYSSGGGSSSITTYSQASASAGGSGGGALQLQGGRALSLEGRVTVEGGSGGSKVQGVGNATAGGGGGGGALLLQAPFLAMGPNAGLLDIRGGSGGTGASGSTGGKGGAGLLRVEQSGTPVDPAFLAKVTAPSVAELALVGATPADVQSSGVLMKKIVGPNGVSGAQSCWLRPDGIFFQLVFAEDGAELGWDMSVLPNPPSVGEQSYRGPNDLFASSLEDAFGNELGTSPIVVRFQGVRIVDDVDDLCTMEVLGADSAIQPGSLTGWVSHPAELNEYYDSLTLRPNAIRFQILFDETNAFASAIAGVSSIRIEAQPD